MSFGGLFSTFSEFEFEQRLQREHVGDAALRHATACKSNVIRREQLGSVAGRASASVIKACSRRVSTTRRGHVLKFPGSLGRDGNDAWRSRATGLLGLASQRSRSRRRPRKLPTANGMGGTQHTAAAFVWCTGTSTTRRSSSCADPLRRRLPPPQPIPRGRLHALVLALCGRHRGI